MDLQALCWSAGGAGEGKRGRARKRLRRIEEDAAASERRAAIIRSDAEMQANRIVSSFLRWYPHMEAACGDGPSLISCIVEHRLLLDTCHMRKSWPVRKG